MSKHHPKAEGPSLIASLVRAIHTGLLAVKEAKHKLRAAFMEAVAHPDDNALPSAIREAAEVTATIYGVRAKASQKGGWTFETKEGKDDASARMWFMRNVLVLLKPEPTAAEKAERKAAAAGPGHSVKAICKAITSLEKGQILEVMAHCTMRLQKK